MVCEVSSGYSPAGIPIPPELSETKPVSCVLRTLFVTGVELPSSG